MKKIGSPEIEVVLNGGKEVLDFYAYVKEKGDKK